MSNQIILEDGAGILARIDDLGRIVIPKPMRTRMGLRERMQVAISADETTIFIRKHCPEGDLMPNICALETQLEGLRYSDDLPADTVRELSELLNQMRDTLAAATETID